MYNVLAQFVNKKFNIDAHYFLKGGFWLSLTQVIVVLTGIVTTSLFAHYLSETDYGIYRYLIGLAVLFSSLSLTGLGQSIFQTAAKKYYGFYQETITINFIYNLGVLFSALAGVGYYFYKGNIVLSIGCLLIAVLQPIINSFQFTSTYLQGSGRFRESTFLLGVKTLLISSISLISLLLTNNIIVLAGVYLTVNTFVNVLSYLWYKPKKTNPTPHIEYAKYLSYAKHTSARNVLSVIANRADAVIIFTQLGAPALAVYTIAMIIPEQIKASFKNFSSLLIPKYIKHSNDQVLKKSIPKRSFQLFFITVIISSLYILLAPTIYELLFPKYTEAIVLSQLVALSLPTVVALLPLSYIHKELAENSLYKIQLLSACVLLILMILGTILFGLIGAILAKVTSRYFESIITFIAFHQISKKVA